MEGNSECGVGADCECGNGYFCPPTSTSSKGKPAIGTDLCQQQADCNCRSGRFCNEGKGERDCIPGHFCKGGRKIICDTAGNWCPAKSTSSEGKPYEPDDNCEVNSVCKCEQGYYCPPGSTTSRGKPFEKQGTCERMQECCWYRHRQKTCTFRRMM